MISLEKLKKIQKNKAILNRDGMFTTENLIVSKTTTENCLIFLILNMDASLAIHIAYNDSKLECIFGAGVSYNAYDNRIKIDDVYYDMNVITDKDIIFNLSLHKKYDSIEMLLYVIENMKSSIDWG